ncbi:MAG: GNAT family N-acetyltransferase [Acidobacteria bacterium]|nr:GNAT family N-acetyltransferase [Acidobacteriota bacterium]
MRVFSSLVYRQARREDLAAASKLGQRVWAELGAGIDELQLRFHLFPKAFQIALVDLQLVGLCFGTLSDQDATQSELTETFPARHMAGGKFFFLYGLTVDPLFRGHGIGSGLVRRELAVARRLHCKKVQLIAGLSSRPLFERLGFQARQRLDHLCASYPGLMKEPVLMEMRL